MNHVSNIKWLDGHRLHAIFGDGAIGECDFSVLVAQAGPLALNKGT
jgi:hypothetical protein